MIHVKPIEIKAIYNKTAKEYEELVIPCKICQYLILIHELELQGNEDVLELGSGPGYLSTEIAKVLKNGMITGIDISENMIELAKCRVKENGLENAQFFVGDVMDLKFEDKYFDICVTSYLIHWLTDIKHFFKEVHRVLKEGGKLGIISPSQEWYHEIQKAFRNIIEKYKRYIPKDSPRELVGLRIYSENELREILAETGFKVHKLISFRYKESTPIDLCLKRINAKSGETYLSFIPIDMQENIKQEFRNELVSVSGELTITESGYIIIAEKGVKI